MIETITSFQNPRIKQIKRLRDRKSRVDEYLFLIDDGRDLTRALEQGFAIDYAIVCYPLLKSEERALLDRIPEERLYSVARDIMEKVSYRENPSGLVSVMNNVTQRGAESLAKITDDRILVLVNLQKPGNIGALLRTADATGFKHVFLVDTTLDLYNPNIIRSSTGACFLRTTYSLTSQEALTFLKNAGYRIVSAVVDGDKTLFTADFKGKVAIVLGTEDEGLPPLWMDSAHEKVKIPMMGQLSDSFNVSVSGAIFMMEALRQNHF